MRIKALLDIYLMFANTENICSDMNMKYTFYPFCGSSVHHTEYVFVCLLQVNNDQVELFYAAFRKLLISSMDSLKRQKKPKTKRTAEWFPNSARLRAEFYIDILCWLCCLPCVCFTVCTATRFWNETRVSCSNLFLSLLLLFVSKLRVPPPPHHPC